NLFLIQFHSHPNRARPKSHTLVTDEEWRRKSVPDPSEGKIDRRSWAKPSGPGILAGQNQRFRGPPSVVNAEEMQVISRVEFWNAVQPVFDDYDVGGQCHAIDTSIRHHKAGLIVHHVLPRLALGYENLIRRGTTYGDDVDLGNWIITHAT